MGGGRGHSSQVLLLRPATKLNWKTMHREGPRAAANVQLGVIEFMLKMGRAV